MKSERYESGPIMYFIRGIEDDMGEGKSMNIMIEQDGDAIITIVDSKGEQVVDMQICTSNGGTHTRGLAMRFKQIAEFLYESQHPAANPASGEEIIDISNNPIIG
jgi:hypothetical protein